MICPKCGFDQPDNPECMRCGIIVSRYKGPIVGAGAQSPPPAFAAPAPAAPSLSPGLPPPPPPLLGIPPPPVISGGTALPPPLPPAAATFPASTFPDYPPPGPAGGTLYDGPPPAAVSGTLYQGPPPGSMAPTFSSFPVTAGPVFHGTFEPGKILGETFSIFFSNIIPFLLLSVLALSPLLLFSAWASTVPITETVAVQVNQLLGSLIQLLCVPIATAAITYGVYQQMRGGTASLVDCLKVGLVTLFPMLGLAFVQGFLIGLGTLACLVPGILLAVRWAVSIPAKVEGRMSVSDAMSRSTYLTEGYRWQVFGVLAVLYALNLVVVFGVGMVVGISSVRSGKVVHPGTIQFMTSLAQVVTTGIAATASAVMYYRLRSVKESVDVDQISSVFA